MLCLPNLEDGRKTAILAGVLLTLTGCTVGPDFVKPSTPENAGFTPKPLTRSTVSTDLPGDQAQSFIEGMDIPFTWWTAFGSPALDKLVERALRHNPTVTIAQATLRQAQEMVYAQQGYFLPTISGDYNFERQQLAGNLGGNSPGVQGNGSTISTYQNPSGPAPYNGPVTYNFHTAQLTVGYTADVFGGNRRQVESLEAQAESQRYLLQATYVTLIDNVVAAGIQEASTRDQIALVTEIINVNTTSVEILRAQFRNGYAMTIDVAGAEAALAQARQLLPPLVNQLDQTRDLIRALVGNLPNQDVEEIESLSTLRLPTELPLSLPSKIIEQRPDVKAAEQQVRSANAQVGVAIAARLPQFSLSGSAGGGASHLSQIFDNGGPFWTLVGEVSAPLFDGNTLLHRERAADQALIQANAQYRSTVITAYQNVADTLHQITSDGDALKAARDAEQAAKTILDITLKRNQAGYVDWLTLHAAEIGYQQAQLNLIQARAVRFGDTAALYQALGGGWWNRSDQASDNTQGDFLLDQTKWLTP